jgi:hypothetical protein
LDERHRLPFTRLESHRGARGNIEASSICQETIEDERRVGLEEEVVRAYLDRTVARVLDLYEPPLAPDVKLDLGFQANDGTRERAGGRGGKWEKVLGRDGEEGAIQRDSHCWV